MQKQTVTLEIPEEIYQRLANTARGMKCSLEDIVIHTLKVGIPPGYDDIPEEFQVDIAGLDRLDDDSLWRITSSKKTAAEMKQYNSLLEANSSRELTEKEQLELSKMRWEADLFMLRKAQAAALLHWRGYKVHSR
ncbi:hypothetical protein [Okeania sp. SIO2B3]|uniref:hypothetical protein n=1 Tax=Okeania sp. SIO2B3 TaxID=2607784 RepID=UPI0013C0CCE9|nr:hypothetical protein [Okeania sp. SIO2B3]NET45512.1 hypothetical protein [Okeania sp. SIO2B3]